MSSTADKFADELAGLVFRFRQEFDGFTYRDAIGALEVQKHILLVECYELVVEEEEEEEEEEDEDESWTDDWE